MAILGYPMAIHIHLLLKATTHPTEFKYGDVQAYAHKCQLKEVITQNTMLHVVKIPIEQDFSSNLKQQGYLY